MTTRTWKKIIMAAEAIVVAVKTVLFGRRGI